MKHRYDPNVPLAMQLDVVAAVSEDPTTQGLLMVVRDGLDLRATNFYTNPTGANLMDLVGWWTRAVKLLESTPRRGTASEGA